MPPGKNAVPVRIVIDTNIAISALFWSGAPHRLLEMARDNRIQVISSTNLLLELEDVLCRPKFASLLDRIGKNPLRVMNDFRRMVEIVASPPLPAPVCRDPDDDAVLACAVAARARLIVSGDADLLILENHQDIPIITADAAVTHVEAQ